MPDFNVRSESVDVEQLMEQIRARIREKRGVDYTEEQLHELAAVKLERFMDPRGVRSDLLERFRQVQADRESPALSNYVFEKSNYIFEETTLYQTHRPLIRWIRRLLQPILKLFFNPNALIQALNIQSRLNTALVTREAERHAFDQLHFEVIHNLVVEATRLGIQVKNLKMQVESLVSRLEFNERRARALESVVVYGPPTENQEGAPADHQNAARPRPVGAPPAGSFDAGASAAPGPTVGGSPEGPGQRSRRRRRRRGRRGGGPTAAMMGQPSTDSAQSPATPSTGSGSTVSSVERATSSVRAFEAQASSPGGPAPEPHPTEPPGDAGSTPPSDASAGSGSTEPGPDKQ